MGKQIFNDLMLFSKEKLHYPYKFRLYFIDMNTMRDEEPVIHRFCVRQGKKFEEYELGGVYNITAGGLYISKSELLRTEDIDEELYHSLVYLRDLIFMDNKSGRYLKLSSEEYNTMDYYWDFSDYKEILAYKPDFATKAMYYVMQFFLYLLSIVLPIGIYMMTLYGFATAELKGIGIWTIPSVAMLSLPMVIWMMNFIFLMGEMVMLNIPALNMMESRKYALRWAGMRREGTLAKRTKKEIITGLAISAGCLIICVIFNLVV